MTDTQKIILIALLALGALCLIVSVTLSHYVGGFIRHVEKEAEEEAEERRAAGDLPEETNRKSGGNNL